MIKILVLIFFFQVASISAQTGGYLGRKHNVTLSFNLNPIYYLANYSRNPPVSTLLWLRPGYEYTLGKSFSVGVEAGFQNFVIGENSAGSAIDQFYNYYYKLSGFDLKFRLRVYSYKSKGVISPIGKYLSFLVGVPYYKSKLSESISIKNNKTSFGIELGSQGVLYNYLTIDYGMSASVSGRYISNAYKSMMAEYGSDAYYDYKNWELEEENHVKDSYQVYAQSQAFGFYLKIGYLL
jgi:hypothetical protein